MTDKLTTDGQDQRLRAALRAEADRHQPDSAAMRARVERGQAAPLRHGRRSPRRTGMRLAGIVVASAVGFALSVAGTWAAVGHFTEPAVPRPTPAVTAPATPPTRAASSPSAHPTASLTPSAAPSATLTGSRSGTASAAPSSAAPAQPAGTRVQQAYLWSDGSIDPSSISSWSQSDITLKTTYTLTALDVTVTLAETPGLSSTGLWSTVPAADLVTSVARQGDSLVYRFTLKPGAVLAPGQYEFAGQYNHADGGRNADADTYRATATGHGQPVEVYGNFF